jgi:hypothetical protein
VETGVRDGNALKIIVMFISLRGIVKVIEFNVEDYDFGDIY